MAAAVRTIDHGLDRELRAVGGLNGRGVKFGIQSDAGVDPESGVDLLDIAIYNEYGTATIKDRPFMGDFADRNGEVLNKAMEVAGTAVQDGRLSAESALDQLGMFAEKHQKEHVKQSKKWAEWNAASTIKNKGSNVPLIDDGVMLGAIRYEKI